MNSYLEELNPQQSEAVKETEGPVLIVAGAGAGKTKTVTHRVFHLIKSGVNPRNILAITFTNKAAREMRERVIELLDKDAEIRALKDRGQVPFISTFHSLGVHIIKENAKILGLSRYFSIYDKSDGKRLIKDALVSLNYDPKQFDPGRIQSAISREKGNFKTAVQYAENVGNEFFPKIVSSVWNIYERALAREQALDFDDLILLAARLLSKNEEVRRYYGDLWKYVHVDEYQDTNTVQYKIVRELTRDHGNICVVGDTDQNIYSWRGADIKNMLRFERDYEKARVVVLEENYRSTQRILKVANDIIKKNRVRIEKKLFTKNEEGQKIGLFSALNETHEAEFVASRAEGLLEKGVDPNKIAILYRANFQSRIIEDAFIARSLPYIMIGIRFFERKEIKDMISLLRASLNPKSSSDLKRVASAYAAGVGEKTVEKILNEEKLPGTTQKKADSLLYLLSKVRETISTSKPSDVIRYAMKESGVEESLKHGGDEGQERFENLMELVTFSSKYDIYSPEEGIERILSDIALAGNEETLDEKEEKKGGVRLMTVHASKGLEFDYVFIAGLEQGLFPHEKISRSGITTEESEEERRLFYVALTRARKKVFLSYAQYRTVFGERTVNIPSEFVYDIEEVDLEDEYLIGAASRVSGNAQGKKVRVIEF